MTWYLVAMDERQDNPGIIVGEILKQPPKFIHEDLRSAEKEALRLATEAAPGLTYTVLKAVAEVVEDKDGNPRWKELDT